MTIYFQTGPEIFKSKGLVHVNTVDKSDVAWWLNEQYTHGTFRYLVV
jgi:hypothetical protein